MGTEVTVGLSRSADLRFRAKAAALLCAVLVAIGAIPPSPAAAAEAGTSAVTLCDVVLEYGESGSCVERLQRRLNELGLNCGNVLAVDGVFGTATRMRVFAFQGRNRLDLVGVVGPVTRAKLADPDEGLAVACDATVERQIRAVFPASIANKAVRVARCESGLNPIAVGLNTNGTKDVGVFQFNTGGTLQEFLPGRDTGEKIDRALSSADNIHAAYDLYRARGWQPWTCRDA
ncbi:putative peptidoglycan binding protein [Kribbella amoyensis]|uniref:Putative peptidoglycan binding protein n=1 Tax=Kribbella amoyensis TaxID=996641 RepID=A0A561BXU1_9ACTN|nr:peptidoglycan-binding protein [Kribbella amoyensis]TWD83705.1 putative peptidoglycan binding protein [Kribbella amoyensis]